MTSIMSREEKVFNDVRFVILWIPLTKQIQTNTSQSGPLHST